eukprot:TRINITY_DN3889_c0_g2_i1.p2 TRINITY_DN3889_c0_g2~~TRINITY_DN3889_c0_g2_i1.p2  ORF type:complete len:146 (-),score=21.24 TRINITY_DN3889_c0_g2_i1:162-599(-)
MWEELSVVLKQTEAYLEWKKVEASNANLSLQTLQLRKLEQALFPLLEDVSATHRSLRWLKKDGLYDTDWKKLETQVGLYHGMYGSLRSCASEEDPWILAKKLYAIQGEYARMARNFLKLVNPVMTAGAIQKLAVKLEQRFFGQRY